MARRILLYSHDTVGLGHIRRMSTIGRELAVASPDDTILILTGSSIAGSLRLPPNADFVKLPSVRKITNERYASRHLQVGEEEIHALRADLVRQTFEHFRPDLFLVDKAPLGVHGDLVPALELARASGTCRVVLGLRDILDEPDEVISSWAREKVPDAIRRYYDEVLVWGDRRVFDVVREYELSDDIAEKITYCGYIAAPPTSEPPTERGRKRRKLVLVTVGGGQDGYLLLDRFVDSLSETTRRFASVVLLGPDLPEDRRAEIRVRIENHDAPIFVLDYTSRIDRLMRSADLVLAMGGYNTVCEIVSRGRPALLVPRVEPRREQLLRARRWESLGLVRVIHPSELTPTALARAIDEELAVRRRPRRSSLDFGGLDRAVEILGSPSSPSGSGSVTPIPRIERKSA